MTIEKIDKLLKHNPWFRDFSDNQRITVYNEVMDDLLALKGNTYLNPVEQDNSPYSQIFIYDLKSLGLSELKPLDERLMDYEFISEFSDEQRLLIYSMAQEEIAEWSIFYQRTEYFIASSSPDKLFYLAAKLTPKVSFSTQFIKFFTEVQTLLPRIDMTAVVLDILNMKNSLISELQLVYEILGFFELKNVLTADISFKSTFILYDTLETQVLRSALAFAYTFAPYDFIQALSLQHPIQLNYSMVSQLLLTMQTLSVPIEMNYRFISEQAIDAHIMTVPIELLYTVIEDVDFTLLSKLTMPILLTTKVSK